MKSKINQKALLKAFKADLAAADLTRVEWTDQRDTWISETYGKAYGNEVEGRSQIVSKDIKKQLEWMIPSITDPFLSSQDVISCNPVTYEDAEAARQNELLLNTQFCRKFPRYNFINKATRVLATEGTVVIQTGWDYKEEEYEEETEVIATDEYGRDYIAMDMVKKLRVLKNQPTATVCRNEDVYIDPTCMDDMDKCQFVIYRYETDISTLKSDGRFKNLDKVELDSNDPDNDSDYDNEDDTSFKFEDKARKKIMVYEYWGNYDVDNDGVVEQVVCAWVGDTIIRLEDNPYPDKKPPFIVVPFNAVPFQLFGEALAENIGDNQKIKTAITRGLIDNMAQSNNGQVGIRRGALNSQNRKRFLAGDNFEFNTSPNDFWQGSYNQIPGSAFNMLSLMNNEIEAQTGVKSFSGGLNGSSLGSSATAARGTLDAAAVRKLDIVRNIAENLIKPLMRKWLSYNSEFLEEEEVVRITNEKFVPIRRDDLNGKIDIDISISTAEDNSAKSQQLSFLLQTLGNTVPFEFTQLILADIAKLSGMPDLEKKLIDFKPQANPMQDIDMQKAKLENVLLEARAFNEHMQGKENEIDRQLKEAKTLVEKARARNLEAGADVADLNYMKENLGLGHQERLELEELRNKLNVQQMMIQKRLDPKGEVGVMK